MLFFFFLQAHAVFTASSRTVPISSFPEASEGRHQHFHLTHEDAERPRSCGSPGDVTADLWDSNPVSLFSVF